MHLAAQLNQSTILTPSERERRKTPQQHAEDVIYTLNHTFTCLTLTDLLIAPVLRGFGMNIGHGHAHHEEPSTTGTWVDTTAQTPPAPPSSESKNEGGLFSRLIDNNAPSNGHAGLHCNDPLHNHGKPSSTDYYVRAGGSSAHVPPVTRTVWQRIKHEVRDATKWRGAGHWLIGEAIGDVGAAAVTIPVQRFFPGVMSGIRQVIEPIFGGIFHRSAERASHKWAAKHGLDSSAQEVVDRAQTLYEYEMNHLPQMVVWTASSIVLHYGAMKKFEPELGIGAFARQKAATAGITAGLVFGARAFAPDKAHKWDETAGKHVVVPLTKTAGKLFGVNARDVDDYHVRRDDRDEPKRWADKVQATPAAATTAVSARSV